MSQILIVDDDPDLLNACTVGLEALGHAVRTAEKGNEGLTEAAIRAPDIIVLDLGLPDLDGLEVCKRIRSWSDVPIIVLSADGSEDRGGPVPADQQDWRVGSANRRDRRCRPKLSGSVRAAA